MDGAGKFKVVRFTILGVVLLLIAFGLNENSKWNRDERFIQEYFLLFEEDSIVTAMVSRHETDLPEISVDILDTKLLKSLLSIIQAKENLSLTKMKNDSKAGTVASEKIFIRAENGAELLLKTWDQSNFAIITDREHQLRDHYTLFLPMLYNEVISPALNTMKDIQ